jgi:hypothetical protein
LTPICINGTVGNKRSINVLTRISLKNGVEKIFHGRYRKKYAEETNIKDVTELIRYAFTMLAGL